MFSSAFTGSPADIFETTGMELVGKILFSLILELSSIKSDFSIPHKLDNISILSIRGLVTAFTQSVTVVYPTFIFSDKSLRDILLCFIYLFIFLAIISLLPAMLTLLSSIFIIR